MITFPVKLTRGQEKLVAMVVDYEWKQIGFADTLSVFSCNLSAVGTSGKQEAGSILDGVKGKGEVGKKHS